MVFLLGGASRPDVQSLLFLRPAGAAVLAFGLVHLTGHVLREHAVILSLAAAWLALHLLHLLPLPPSIWSNLPGREIISEVDRAAMLGSVWRPLSMAPDMTLNSLWAAIIPVSVLVLGVQLSENERFKLVPVILAVGALSASLGLVQVLSDPDGPLFFYAYTSSGSAVGLFANRNHQGVFLATLLPLLLLWAQSRRVSAGSSEVLRLSAAAAGAAFVIPLILVTGSRAGMIAGVIALLALPWLITARKGNGRASWIGSALRSAGARLLTALAGLALVGATVFFGRALAFDRLLGSDITEELRLAFLPLTWEMTKGYAPLGSGLGSFEQVYRIHEPDAMLLPQYINHAHNDWLELALTGGLPAIFLLAITGGLLGRRAWSLLRKPRQSDAVVQLGRTGLVVLLLLGLASLPDYPLRVPSLGVLAVIALLWTTPFEDAANR